MVRKENWYDFSPQNLLRFVLCPVMWSALEDVVCVLGERSVRSAVGCNVLCISDSPFALKYSWFSISLFIFCLGDLPVGDRGILKSPITIVLSVSFLKTCQFLLNIFQCSSVYFQLSHLDVLTPLSYVWLGFSHFELEVYFIGSCFLLGSACLEYHLPSLYFEPACA